MSTMIETVTTKPAILFVCLGNICRSPMAEGALRHAVEQAGLDFKVDSVGTADYHSGEFPDPRAIQTARAHGVDISGLCGRQLSESDFHQYTHIFAMDKANLAGIKARAPRQHNAKLALLLDLLPDRKGEAVEDPFYGDDNAFEECWNTISLAIDELIKQFADECEAA